MTRLAFPYRPASSGRSATVTYGSDAHVHQMLELLIFTMAGERVMRPDLGSPVNNMVFGAAGMGTYRAENFTTKKTSVGYLIPVQSHPASALTGEWTYLQSGYSGPNSNFVHWVGKFDIKADASPDEIKALVAQSQKRSAVYDVITNPTNVTVEVRKA